MSIWNEGGFFRSVKGHLFKWWQIVIMPVFRVNNNPKNETVAATPVMATPPIENSAAATPVIHNSKEEAPPTVVKTDTSDAVNTPNIDDASEILKRLKQEQLAEEERKRKEIEVLRRKTEEQQKKAEECRRQAEEQEKIAAIMNANKVSVEDFIAEGKANRKSQEEIAAQNEKEEKEAAKKLEDLKRAQEIIDRLNREAAEDVAKKEAEIARAKEEARGKFG